MRFYAEINFSRLIRNIQYINLKLTKYKIIHRIHYKKKFLDKHYIYMYFIFSSCELDLHTDVLRQGRKLRGIWNYSIYTIIVNHQRKEIRSLYIKCNYILELDKQRELMTIIYKRAFNSSLIKLKNLSSHITQTNPLERTLINPYWKCSY